MPNKWHEINQHQGKIPAAICAASLGFEVRADYKDSIIKNNSKINLIENTSCEARIRRKASFRHIEQAIFKARNFSEQGTSNTNALSLMNCFIGSCQIHQVHKYEA